jgi:hypothetical protein
MIDVATGRVLTRQGDLSPAHGGEADVAPSAQVPLAATFSPPPSTTTVQIFVHAIALGLPTQVFNGDVRSTFSDMKSWISSTFGLPSHDLHFNVGGRRIESGDTQPLSPYAGRDVWVHTPGVGGAPTPSYTHDRAIAALAELNKERGGHRALTVTFWTAAVGGEAVAPADVRSATFVEVTGEGARADRCVLDNLLQDPTRALADRVGRGSVVSGYTVAEVLERKYVLAAAQKSCDSAVLVPRPGTKMVITALLSAMKENAVLASDVHTMSPPAFVAAHPAYDLLLSLHRADAVYVLRARFVSQELRLRRGRHTACEVA